MVDKRARSCRNKKRYQTEDQAQQRASYLNARDIFVKPYFCQICKQYHLTSRSKQSVLSDLFKRIEKEKRKRETKKLSSQETGTST